MAPGEFTASEEALSGPSSTGTANKGRGREAKVAPGSHLKATRGPGVQGEN